MNVKCLLKAMIGSSVLLGVLFGIGHGFFMFMKLLQSRFGDHGPDGAFLFLMFSAVTFGLYKLCVEEGGGKK